MAVVPDVGLVAGSGIGSVLVALIGVPLWRTFLAKQNAATKEAQGEAGWQKRQAEKIIELERLMSELLKLRANDAEKMAALMLKDAMSGERHERLLEHIERLTQRGRALENYIIELRPDLEKWVRTDFAPIGPPEVAKFPPMPTINPPEFL